MRITAAHDYDLTGDLIEAGAAARSELIQLACYEMSDLP